MQHEEFSKHMARLVNQFGKAAYGTERMALIYREVQAFSEFWWKQTVDHLILTCRQAPLFEDFAQAISRERENLHRRNKEQYARDVQAFHAGQFHPDETKHMFHTIREWIKGNVSDADYGQFKEHLQSAAQGICPQSCKTCGDRGVVFEKDKNNYEWAYRCSCSAGFRKRPNLVVVNPQRAYA